MRHHAILVTTLDKARAQQAHRRASAIFADHRVSAFLASDVNEYYTITIGPDGSKEGWSESHAGDKQRETFIAWLNSKRYDDGSSPYDWCEVQYGDEDGDDRILATQATERPGRAGAAQIPVTQPGLCGCGGTLLFKGWDMAEGEGPSGSSVRCDRCGYEPTAANVTRESAVAYLAAAVRNVIANPAPSAWDLQFSPRLEAHRQASAFLVDALKKLEAAS